jgi:chitinase
MRRRTVFYAGGVAAVIAGVIATGVATSQAQTTAAAAVVAPQAAFLGAAPYEFPATGGKDPVAVMNSTGVHAITLAFILNKGGCQPAWDGSGSLTGGAIVSRINAIRNAGGDVVVSFGGAEGNKLGNACGSASALAGAYQKVINQYKLRAIDIDLEAGEVSQSSKVLSALKIVKQKNPGVQIIMTLGTGTSGLVGGEAKIPGQAAKMGSPVDVWTIMPFDFGTVGGSADMGKLSVQASEGLHKQLKAAFKTLSDDQIYRMQGISSMNAHTDTGENVTVAHFKTMLKYCQQHHLARFTFWELNRDGNLQYAKVVGQFHG